MKKLWLCAIALCVFSNVAGAQTFSVDTTPQNISSEQVKAVAAKKMSEEAESKANDGLMTTGVKGLKNPGDDVQASSKVVTESSIMPVLVEPEIELMAETYKKPGDAVKVVQKSLMLPTDAAAAKMAPTELTRRREMISRMQSSAAADAIAGGIAHSNVSIEHGDLQKKLEQVISDATDVRGDFQAQNQAILLVLSEMNRMAAVTEKDLATRAAQTLTTVRSSSAVVTKK